LLLGSLHAWLIFNQIYFVQFYAKTQSLRITPKLHRSRHLHSYTISYWKSALRPVLFVRIFPAKGLISARGFTISSQKKSRITPNSFQKLYIIYAAEVPVKDYVRRLIIIFLVSFFLPKIFDFCIGFSLKKNHSAFDLLKYFYITLFGRFIFQSIVVT